MMEEDGVINRVKSSRDGDTVEGDVPAVDDCNTATSFFQFRVVEERGSVWGGLIACDVIHGFKQGFSKTK